MTYTAEERLWQSACAVAMGVATWALLAAFVALEQERSNRDLQLAIGIAGFLLYLVEIGYLIYLRSYPPTPHEPVESTRRTNPIFIWMGTIVIVGAFGVTMGVGFPKFAQTFGGNLLVQTITFGGVAAGLIFTATGLPHRRPRVSEQHHATSATAEFAAPAYPAASTATEPVPPFWLVALRLIGWQLVAVIAFVFFFGPVMLLQKEFDRWIDIPACQRLCAHHGLAFESFASGKSFYNCVCAGAVFHERAYLPGGSSFASCTVDWMFRAGTSFLVGLGWPFCVMMLYLRISARRELRAQRGTQSSS